MDVYQRRRLVALSILAGVFVIVVLLIRSCGGDDEEEPAPLAGATGVGGVTAPSQEDYISQADASCLEANTSLAAVDTSDPTAAATDEGQILAGELTALQGLPAPAEGTEELDKFLSALQEQVSVYDDYITALERGDAAASELEATIEEAAAKVQKKGEKFGFEVCGDPSQVGESSGDEEPSTESEEPADEVTEPVPVAPTETTPAPVTPAPTDDGGVAPATPAPTDDTESGSGGVSP